MRWSRCRATPHSPSVFARSNPAKAASSGPSVRSFTGALQACAQGSNWQIALSLLEHMAARQLAPDKRCFDIALRAHRQAQKGTLSQCTQKLVETASWEKIAAAVGSELELWQRYFPEVRPSTSVGSLWQQKPEPDRALWDLVRGPVAAEQNLSHGSTSVWLVVGGLLLAASLLLREAPVSLALPTPGAYGAPPVLAFGLYCFLWCVRALLQRAACEDGANHSPLACSLAVALLQCCTSAGLLPAIRAVGGAKSFRQTWYSRPAGVPVWQLTVAAGAVHSARVWLSFVSLSFLDPLSFVLLAAFQVSIELLLPWRERPGQPQGHLRYLALAMALLAALCQGEELWHAGARKMLGVAAALAYALLGTLLTFLHNKVSRLDISKDLMQLGQHAAGFLTAQSFVQLQAAPRVPPRPAPRCTPSAPQKSGATGLGVSCTLGGSFSRKWVRGSP
eukprot:s4284_g3.t1